MSICSSCLLFVVRELSRNLVNNSENSNKQSLIRLSQSHLNILEICPPQFQRLYLEQLGSPMSPEIQDNLAWGSQFHQLMQQRELGLSIESILNQSHDLQHTVNALWIAVDQQHNLTQQSWREAEHSRTLEFRGYLLTAIYDLLILDDKQAQILDWKTYLQPQNEQKLKNNWQTRLYLYLLAESSDYLPEHISMTYWFVKIPHEPKFWKFQYSETLHQKNHQDLSDLLTNLDDYLKDYNEKNINFPHPSYCQEKCPYSNLFFENNQGFQEEKNNDLSSKIEEIEEVSI